MGDLLNVYDVVKTIPSSQIPPWRRLAHSVWLHRKNSPRVAKNLFQCASMQILIFRVLCTRSAPGKKVCFVPEGLPHIFRPLLLGPPYGGTGELQRCVPPKWDATMPAYGLEDGGGVVAQRLAVMARTWGRSRKVSLSKRKSTDTERKADDGPSRLVHLSVGNGESALPESTGPTGKGGGRNSARP